MKIHVVSETPFIMKATGVHTAFMDHVELLKEKNDIEVTVNGEGHGDIFHGHTYGLYYIWKGRRVFTAHVIPDSIKGSLPSWHFFMPFVKLGLRIVYSYADVCIAISPTVEKAIIETGAHTRIVRINNPIDVNKWKRTEEKRERGRRMLGISGNDFVVLGVGQLTGRKGIEDFIDISAAIHDAKFVWVGGRPFRGFSEGILRINEKIKKAGNNFIRTRPVLLEQMPDIYAAADLMLFTSYQENCPLAPLEASASPMPVIFRDIEEYRLLYQNPYLKAAGTGEFIDMTKRIMQDRQLYSEGIKISEQLLTQFERENIRRELISVYNSLTYN